MIIIIITFITITVHYNCEAMCVVQNVSNGILYTAQSFYFINENGYSKLSFLFVISYIAVGTRWKRNDQLINDVSIITKRLFDVTNIIRALGLSFHDFINKKKHTDT